MKKLKLVFILIFCFVSFAFAGVTVCFAEDWVLYTGKVDPSAENKISYGIDVLADKTKTEVAGLCGQPLSFSCDKFACAMNLRTVQSITVTSLPDARAGVLYLGSNAVSAGDTIRGEDISRLSFEQCEGTKKNRATFKYRINSSGYEIECVIYMLDKMNASPTVGVASYASLNLLTYKGISVSGVLSAHDPDGDGLTYEIVKYPSDGILTLEDDKNGIYTYVPDKTFTGEDEFIYVVKDQYGNYSEGVRVNIDVEAPSVAVKYSDLEESNIYNYAINMTELGIMNGERVGDNYYFRPDTEVSRGDFLVSAMKALGITSVPAAATTPFTDDTDIGDELKGYVNLAYAKGYVSGISDGEGLYFRADEKITISEASVIISNMIGYASPEALPTFSDADNIPEWSEKAVLSLHTLGILECFDNSIGADRILSRADMAKMLSRSVVAAKNI